MLHPVYALKRSGYTAEYNAGWAADALEDFYEVLPEGEETYIAALRKMASHLYNSVLSRSGKRYFLDKTPPYYLIIPELLRIFPKAHYIILYRNPLAVLSSIFRMRAPESEWWKWGRLKNNESALFRALRMLLEGEDLLGERGKVVHYEEFVKEPEKVSSELCDYLGIEFLPQMMAYRNNSHLMGRNGDPTNIHINEKPVTDYIDKWKEMLVNPEGAALAKGYLDLLGPDLLRRIGYPREELNAMMSDNSGDGNRNVVELNREGEKLFAKGDIEGALSNFNQALQIDPDNAEVLNNLGVLYVSKGIFEEATRHLKRSLEINPYNRDTVLNYGDVCRAMKKVDSVEKIYRDYLERHPADSEIENLLREIGGNGRKMFLDKKYQSRERIQPSF